MNVEAAITALIKGGATAVGNRVYPERIPEREAANPTFPMVIYHVIDEVATNSRDTNAADDSDLVRFRFQLDLLGTTYEQVRALWQEIRPLVKAFDGSSAGESIRTFIQSASSTYRASDELFVKNIDIIVWRRD